MVPKDKQSDLISFIKNAAKVFRDRPFFVGRIKAALKYNKKKAVLPLQIHQIQYIKYDHPEVQGAIVSVSGRPLIYLMVSGPNVERFRELSKQNELIRGQAIAYTSECYEKVMFKVASGRGILHKDIAGDTILLESDVRKERRRKQFKLTTPFKSSLAVKKKSSKPSMRNIEVINSMYVLTQGETKGSLTGLSTSPMHPKNNPESLKQLCNHAMHNTDQDVDTDSRVSVDGSKTCDTHSSKKLGNLGINLEYLKLRELKPGYRNFYGIIVEEKMQKYLGSDRRNVQRAEIMLRVIDETSLQPFVILVDVNCDNLRHYGLNKIIGARNVFIKDSGTGLVGTAKDDDILFKDTLFGVCSESERLGFVHLENWLNSNVMGLDIKIEDDHEMPEASAVVAKRLATSTSEIGREGRPIKTEMKSEYISNTSIHIIEEAFEVLENTQLTLDNSTEPYHRNESLIAEQQSQIPVKIDYPEIVTISDEEEGPLAIPNFSNQVSALKIEDLPILRQHLFEKSQDVTKDGSDVPKGRDWYSSEGCSLNEKRISTEPKNAAQLLQVQAQPSGEDNQSKESCIIDNGTSGSRNNENVATMTRDFVDVENNEGKNATARCQSFHADEDKGKTASISESCTIVEEFDPIELGKVVSEGPIIPKMENSSVAGSNADTRGGFDLPIAVPFYDDVDDPLNNSFGKLSGMSNAMVSMPSSFSIPELCISQAVRVIIDRLDSEKLKQNTSVSSKCSSPSAVNNNRKNKKKIKKGRARARKVKL